MATTTPSRPSLSKKSPFSTSRPSLDSPSVFGRLQEAALALLPQRRASPVKSRSASTTTPATLSAKKSSPFYALSSSRHKPSLSSPAAVQVTSPLGNKALPPQKPLPTTPPPLPPKSAPATPSYALGTRSSSSKAPAVPQVSQSLRSRPTIPFASSSSLTKPTAASSARSRPPVPVATPSSSSTSTVRTSGHTRTLSKSRPEPSTPSSPTSSGNKTPTLLSSMTSRLRASPSPNPESKRESPELRISSPIHNRPRFPNRTPISPPSAFSMKSTTNLPASSTTSQSLTRRRSKTFPSPSDPEAPVPPSTSPPQTETLSRPLRTANRILEAFDPSPRMNDSPEPIVPMAARSKSTSPTPIRPARPIRASSDNAFMAIPSQSKSPSTHRIVPSAASIEASATRVRPAISGPSRTLPSSRSSTLISPSHASRPSLDQSLPPPPRTRQPLSPTLSSSGVSAQTRRRPTLRPIQTTPIDAKEVSNPITIVKAPSPVTPETQPSSASPKTPATYVEPSSYFTSDEESRPRKRGAFKGLFGRKRPDSLVSSSSAVTGSGTSNASLAFGVGRAPPMRQPKAPSTFGGVAEEEELMMMPPSFNLQTRRGIRRVAEIPYPVSFEELALQGEKHTHELLSLVRQQKAYHFTQMDNFAKLKNILDIGCGRGYWLMDAAKECKHANLVGFDIADVFMSPSDMRIKRGLNESQISRIEFVQGNFFNTLPFPSDQFDYIRLAFLELAIPSAKWVPLLKEAWRVLKAGGHIEVVIESQLFPTVWSYNKRREQEELEQEFRTMLAQREIPEVTNIGEKMFFDAFARVQTHQHVSVCIAPRAVGRTSLDASPRNFGSMRSMHSPMHSPWSSEPVVPSGMVSPTPFGRPSLDRSGSSMDVLPPSGQLVTSKTCSVPGIVISPDTFIPVSEDTLYTYASHGAMILNATRLASFYDKYPDASLDNYETEWRAHVARYWQYETETRSRLGFRQNQFGDDDDEMPTIPAGARWKWAKCEDDLERPLEIRRFRAWSLSKPLGSR
ncbi:hypothetical protein FRC19_008638 [Serendipita sp. 401]|nr:hypothetical protein FRC19_008638 [Serendipita sp. 401]